MEDSLNDLFDMINIGPRIDVFEMTTIKRDPVTRVANPLSFGFDLLRYLGFIYI